MAPGLTDIMGLISNLPSFLSLIDNIMFVIICLFFGSFAMNGWKRYKNYGIKVIGSVGLGFLCLLGSIILTPYVPLQLPFLGGAIPAFITAVILYAILSLLSGKSTTMGKYVKSENYEELMNKFNGLVDEVKRLKSMLKRKDIIPQELPLKDLEKELNNQLKERKINQFSIISKLKQEDVIHFTVKSLKKQYKASFDSYTAELIGFEQVNLTISQNIIKGLHYLWSNKRVLIGLILVMLVASFTLSKLSPEVINSFNQRMQFTVEGVQASQAGSAFTNYSITNTSCLSVADLLFVQSRGLLTKSNQTQFNATRIQTGLNSYPSDFMVPLIYNYQGGNYALLMLSSIAGEELIMALSGGNPINLLLGMGSMNMCTTNYGSGKLSDYLTICSANINIDRLCQCTNMTQLGSYCSAASNLLISELTSQFTGMLG